MTKDLWSDPDDWRRHRAEPYAAGGGRLRSYASRPVGHLDGLGGRVDTEPTPKVLPLSPQHLCRGVSRGFGHA